MVRSLLILSILIFGCGPTQDDIDSAIESAIKNIPEVPTPVISVDSTRKVVGDSELHVELAGWVPEDRITVTIVSAYGVGVNYTIGSVDINSSGAGETTLGSDRVPAIPEDIVPGVYTIRAVSVTDGSEASTALRLYKEALEIIEQPIAPVISVDSTRKVVGDSELHVELAGWVPGDRITVTIVSAYGVGVNYTIGSVDINSSGAGETALGSDQFPAVPDDIVPGVYTIRAVSVTDGSEASTALRVYKEALEIIEQPIAPVILIDSTRKVVGDSELHVELAGWAPEDRINVTIVSAYGAKISYTVGSIDTNLSGAGETTFGSNRVPAIPDDIVPGVYTIRAVSVTDGSEASTALRLYKEALEIIEQPTEPDFNRIWKDFTPSIFYVQDPATTAYGTGWLYKDGIIITVNHVVGSGPSMKVFQMTGLPFVASVVVRDASRDIAVLKFDPGKINLPEGAKPLLVGDIDTGHYASPLMALGYSDRGTLINQSAGRAAANVGVLSQVKIFSQGQSSPIKHIMMDAPIAPGDSGGPVVDTDGMVIGMTRSYSTNPGTFFAIHEDVIKESLALFLED
ncbi:MAG: serine protease [Dehalococcoidia bacterium]